ncbi:MAG: hypothetical protein ABIO06_04745 [Pseudolysinimonas sp.]
MRATDDDQPMDREEVARDVNGDPVVVTPAARPRFGQRLSAERAAAQPVVAEPVVAQPVVAEPVSAEPVVADTSTVPARHEAVVDDETAHREAVVAREDMVAREKLAYGGMKFGTAFFGWLTATGTAVLLSALVAAVLGAVGFRANENSVKTNGLGGAIVLVVILFIAYLAGGYVAGRMARFSGAKQGVAVWLWALVIAIVVSIIGLIGGRNWDILANLNTFPQLPFGQDQITIVGVISAVVLLVVTLLGAVLGGVLGMRFHRRVDRAGVGE